MSRARRQRDSVAPTLFPFLAVLLCTMGALVLILMLIVTGAQASAQHIAQESDMRAEEAKSQLQLATHSFEKQLKEGRLELEKKRLALQHLEKHIQELLAELEQLERKAELAQSEIADDAAAEAEQAAAISRLEQQLLEAGEKLRQKLEKPKGDKPIFAIIPYDGPNGTHRRPIYLECTEVGLKIQPEGVLLRPEDLQPPFGPGNPLDAALRTIRGEYAPANGAVTSTAYPLLIVRPSGIRSYAMARAAMSGWDDQFGYELISEDLELTFPESQPGLKNKIVQSLDLARQRQAALVMAMPRRYRDFAGDELLGGGSGGAGGSGSGYGAEGAGGATAGAGTGGGSDAGLGSSGGRGGFALDGSPTSSEPSGAGGAPGSLSSDGSGYGFGLDPSGFAAGGPAAGMSPDMGGLAAGGEPLAGGPGNVDGQGTPSPTTASTNGDPLARRDGQTGGERLFGWSQSGGNDGGSPANSDYADPNHRGGNSPDGSSSGGGGSSGGTSQGSGGKGGGGPRANMSGGSLAQGSAAGGGSPSSGATQSGGSTSAAGMQGSEGGMNQVSLSNSPLRSSQENAPPVAKQRGRNWAWSKGPPTQTPVVRAIRLQCLNDRWVVLPDSGSAAAQTVNIAFDSPPQARAEKLASVIADRVDSWGLALGDGYWKPLLEVEVAPDAGWRYQQLTQLLEGSGLDVQQIPPRSK